jgi:hypothetical protein
VRRIPTAYLVIIGAILVAVVAAAGYLRWRAAQTEQAAAECVTPAPPPRPATPPPKVPGFAVEAGCGPGELTNPSSAPKK